MEIPDLKIECLRCTASEMLAPGAVQKDAEGKWQPINTRRPEGWLQGPASLQDPTQGVCPKCAGDWLALQGTFLASKPSDPTVEVRDTPDITFKPKATSTVPLRVGQIPSAHIPLRDEEPARTSSIPVVGETVAAPQVTMQAAAPAPAMQQMWHNRNVKVEPLRTLQASVPAQRISSFAQPAQTVRMQPIAQINGHIAHAGVRSTSIPAATSQRIMPAASAPAPTPMPLSQSNAPAQTSYNVVKVEHGVKPVGGTSSAPTPIVAGGHLQSQGGMVTTSAPVPIRQASANEDGEIKQGVVTISAPVPIATKE